MDEVQEFARVGHICEFCESHDGHEKLTVVLVSM